MPDHVVQRLSCHSNWLGVKECTGNNRIQNYTDQGIMCWSGNDDEAHDSRHDHGGQVGLLILHVPCMPPWLTINMLFRPLSFVSVSCLLFRAC